MDTGLVKRLMEHWPAPQADLRDYKDGKVAFELTRVTVKKVFDNSEKGTYGLKFVEDTTPSGQFSEDGTEYIGVIWNFSGKWDKETKTRARYIGDKYQDGEVIEAALTIRTGDTRSFYDVAFANRTTAQPPQQPEAGEAPEDGGNAASGGQGDDYWAERQRNIIKGQALNLLFETINAYVPLAEKVESLKEMGFGVAAESNAETMLEAKQIAGEQWNNLRLGFPAFPDPEPVEPHEPEHESGSAPAEDDWESVPGWNE